MATKKSTNVTEKKAIKSAKVHKDSGKVKKNVEVADRKKALKAVKVQPARRVVSSKEMDDETRMMHDVIVIANNIGIDVVKVITTEIVRAIQRAEGYAACYMTGEVLSCGQVNCLWRTVCAFVPQR